jgi:hypothetical protein
MQYNLYEKYFWMDVWELNPERLGIILAEGLYDLLSESFWLKASMPRQAGHALFQLHTGILLYD